MAVAMTVLMAVAGCNQNAAVHAVQQASRPAVVESIQASLCCFPDPDSIDVHLQVGVTHDAALGYWCSVIVPAGAADITFLIDADGNVLDFDTSTSCDGVGAAPTG